MVLYLTFYRQASSQIRQIVAKQLWFSHHFATLLLPMNQQLQSFATKSRDHIRMEEKAKQLEMLSTLLTKKNTNTIEINSNKKEEIKTILARNETHNFRAPSVEELKEQIEALDLERKKLIRKRNRLEDQLNDLLPPTPRDS